MDYLEENKGFVYKMAYSFNKPHHLDDLVAAGNMGLVEAHKRYDPARGVKFLTFAYNYVRYEMQKYLKKDQSTVEFLDKYSPVAEALIPASRDLNSVLNGLSYRDQQIVRERFENDKTLLEVAQELGVTKQRVSQMESKILRTLRKRLYK